MQKRQNNARAEKIASKVQTLVAEILRDKYNDDKIVSGVSLVDAKSHGGFEFVRLYFYSRTDGKVAETKLNAIAKNIRYELAGRLNQKYVPELQFVYDDTLERANRIEELLNNLN